MKKTNWKKIVSVLCILLFVVSIPAQISGRIDTKEAGYREEFVINFSQENLIFEELSGYSIIRYGDCVYSTVAGEPQVPFEQLKLPVPSGVKISNVYIKETTTEGIYGTYNLYPVQPPTTVMPSGNEELIVQPDVEIYSSNQQFPSDNVRFIDRITCDDKEFAVVEVCPVSYIPSEQELTFLSSIAIVVEGEYVEFVSNTPQTLSLEPGDYDMVIITPEDWEDDFQPLADWRTQRGIPTKIVTTQWIYSQYSGSYPERIQAFIIDAEDDWNCEHYLLGGDTDYIPYYIHQMYLEGNRLIPTDVFYGDTNGNIYNTEVNIGRASVRDEDDIVIFIDKVFTYEKNPPMTDYVKKAGLFGFDLDGSSDGEDVKIHIHNYYISGDWDVTTVYDSHGGDHKQNVINAINDGQHMLNHIDHCDYYIMGVGSYNHGLWLYMSDVNAFNNGDKQSIMYSIGCWALAYDYETCIAEAFVKNDEGGGLVFTGNTRYGWYQIGNPGMLSGYYDKMWWQRFFANEPDSVGDLFTMHKNAYYPSDNYWRYVYICINMLGDPQLQLWYENPQNIVVTHPATLPLGTSSFDVHVEVAGGGDLANAYVCLWKGDEVYLTGNTNANGDATFNPSPSTAGDMYVTVTKKNYIPYEGIATVGGPTGPDPDRSSVELTGESMDGMVTCPAGDTPPYRHVKVTVRNAMDEPLSGIPAEDFTLYVSNVGADWYGTLSCTFTAVDPVTNGNGEIRFEIVGDTSIVGDIAIHVIVQEIELTDAPVLTCKSPDYAPCDGAVDLGDFTIFGSDWGSEEWRSDFTFDGIVDLGDFTMFGGHWGHSA